MDPESFKAFKDTLRKIANELEEVWIEKEIYQQIIILAGVATLENLKEAVAKEIANPETRKRTREQFAQMWKGLDETGTAAWIEDPANNPPPTGKPN